MATKVPNDDLAARVAALVADMDALDRGLVDVGVVAARALDKAEGVEHGLASAWRAAYGDDPEPTVSYADPVAARAWARRRRIERSGLHVIRGGAR
jgi:hypothetical protein